MAELSPAAQAVREAARKAWCQQDYPVRIVAAALLALADQAGSAKHWHVNELRAIAAELEAKQ